jgi:hypothetical protein
MPPIRRSAALKPLSSEHHQALLTAFQAKHVSEGRAVAGAPAELSAFVDHLRRFAADQLAPHFAAEESLIGSAVERADLQRLQQEHEQLRVTLASLDTATSDDERRATLGLFGTLLEAHVRWEERELFGRIEASLPAQKLRELGERLAEMTIPAACSLRAR